MPGEHLTNLESTARITSDLAKAESDAMVKPDDAAVMSALHLARARAKGHNATLELMEREFGPLVIGKPRKTKFKTAELLEEQGYVGVYRRG